MIDEEMSSSSMTAWFRRSILIVVASCLVWRIVASGMAEHYSDQIGVDPGAANAALAWNPHYPKALRSLAEEWESSDPEKAEAFFARAYQGNPTDGRALLSLAGLWRKQGKLEQADRACELAERLLPADSKLRLSAAQYWLASGNLQKTLKNWDLAMQINPKAAQTLFPTLITVARDPAGLSALGPVISGLPSWWQGFFDYAAQNLAELDVLRALYSMRKAAAPAPAPVELNAYLSRLTREGLWTEAYLDWINALRPEQERALGYLYDGGFEQTEFKGGFDWSAATDPSIQVTTNYAQMVTGNKALHVVFNGRTLPFSVVEQTAFLLPGQYRFSGRVRPDALQAAGGLEWALECVPGTGDRLATSERFLGSDTWRKFTVDFEVATNACAGVRLRLLPVGYQTDDREIKGEIWFDDLAIELSAGPASKNAGDAPTKTRKSNPARRR